MDLPGRIINNRYKIKEKLSEDRTSDIYLATDIKRTDLIYIVRFIKSRVTSRGVEDVIRFRSDVIKASELDHPNILKIIETGEVTGGLYLITEYFPGITLTEFLKDDPLPPAQALSLMIQTLRGIAAFHEQRIIHRDINSDNILVAEDGSIKIYGFGLSHIKEFSEIIKQDEIMPAFGFLSPEQCGILKRTIDERSDLYSAGVLFYRMLTGGFPFTGDDLCSFAHNQIASQPRPPGGANPVITEDFSRVVLKAIEKEPDRRYQSAEGMLHDLKKLQNGETDFPPGLNDRVINLNYRTGIIGREDELFRLRSMFDNLKQNAGSVALIHGGPGSGRTRLIEEFNGSVYAGGGMLINVRCHEADSSTPYAPVREALGLLMDKFDGYNEARKQKIREQAAAEFGPLAQILIDLNPVTAPLFGEPADLNTLEEKSEGKRFLSTVGRFLTTAGMIGKNIVLSFDDLQWADEGTFTLLAEMLRQMKNSPVLMLCSYRDDEKEALQPINRFIEEIDQTSVPKEEFVLRGLTRESLKCFITGMLYGNVNNLPALTEFIFHRSTGNPFAVKEILKALVANQTLTYSGNSWTIRGNLEEVDVPLSIIDLIFHRITLLSEKEREIITIGAVIGKKFSAAALTGISGYPLDEIITAVDRGIQLQIIEESSREKRELMFVHEKIREAFHGSIAIDTRKSLHLRIARLLESSMDKEVSDIIFDIAYHYIESEESGKIVEYAFPAGMLARERFAYDDAARFFEKTREELEKKGLTSGQTWTNSGLELGSIYVIIGRYDTALKIFNELIPLVSSTSNESYLYRQMSGAYYRKGEWAACEEFAARGLALPGEEIPRTRSSVIKGIVKEACVHFIHIAIPGLFVRRKENPRGDRYKMIVGFYESLGMSYALSNQLKLLRLIIRVVNIAERHIGPSQELGMGLYALGGMYMSIPLFKSAEKYLFKSLTLMKKINFEWGKAKVYELLGYCREWQGRFQESEEFFKRSAEIFTLIGDVKEHTMALNGLEHTYYYRGDYPAALAANQRYYEIVSGIKDYYSIGAAEIYFSQYYRETGKIVKAYNCAERARIMSKEKDIPFNYCSALNELGAHALELGEPDRAILYLEEAREIYEKNHFLKQYVLPLYYNLVRAYTAYFIFNEQEMGRDKRKQYLKKIHSASRKALRVTRRWPTHYPASLLSAAQYFVLAGRNTRADALFREAIQRNKTTGRAFEHARSLYEYGIFLSQADDLKGSRAKLEAAYRLSDEIGARIYRDRAGMFLGVKGRDSGPTPVQRLIERERRQALKQYVQQIYSIEDVEPLLDSAVKRAVELAGADRGVLFIVSEDSKRLTIGAVKNYSQTAAADNRSLWKLAEGVYERGKYRITSDTGTRMLEGERGGREERSLLCLPVRSRFRTVGVCYLDSPLSEGLFTEKTARLLIEFFSQVGIAIENVLLYTRMDLPQSQKKEGISAATEEKLGKAIAYIDENYHSDISREGLAAHLGISPDHLGKAFKLSTGEKLNEYINRLRIREASEKLLKTDDKIIEIAFSVGFESLSTFNRAFQKVMKMTPKRYRKERKGAE